jgi:succinyl-diaminopimelate desuccinylase
LALCEDLSKKEQGMKRGLLVFFDAAEHTGKFEGTKALLKSYKNILGALIGYPGNDQLCIGSRGFYRAYAHVEGTSTHSGSRKELKDNAIDTAIEFIAELKKIRFEPPKGEFPNPPKISVTAIHGGEFFSMIPNMVTLNIDVRTTPEFDDQKAEALLKGIGAKFAPKVMLEKFESWPAFMLGEKNALREVMGKVFEELNIQVPFEVSGLSNSGNLMSKYGIPAVAGYGVKYENAHGSNERILVESIPLMYDVYLKAAEKLTGLS